MIKVSYAINGQGYYQEYNDKFVIVVDPNGGLLINDKTKNVAIYAAGTWVVVERLEKTL